MSPSDDRKEFEDRKRASVIALGRDTQIFDAATNLILATNKHHYSYLWSWMGVPIIQLPADILATQEVIWATKPDVIIETGVARGGSLLFMASMLELIGKGKVLGVDIDIRAHNRDSIERHPMGKRIQLIDGSSIDLTVIERVKAEIARADSVMVVLDSDHSRDHVLAELRAYGPMVTEGCYLVVADTLLGFIDEGGDDGPKKWPRGNEPLSALNTYLAETDRFVIDDSVNGKLILSSSPGGYLVCRTRT